MPEAPDLQVVKEYLQERVIGLEVTEARERRPLILRNLTGAPFEQDAAGRSIDNVRRRGKMLLLDLSEERLVVVNPMLAGKITYCSSKRRLLASTYVTFALSNGCDIRYSDAKRMGMVYYLLPDQVSEVPRLNDQGPDVIDDRLEFEGFVDRLRPFRGEIKGVLTRGKAVSGIGNAYADEILFAAGIFPFTKQTRLAAAEVRRLHGAVYAIPTEALETLRERVGDAIDRKDRSFLRVHGRTGEPCPECGTALTGITANQRLTNYCRRCQPGSLFRRD